VDEFIRFIEEELAARSVNVLVLRVDYGFQFVSRPEMADKGGLSKEQAQKIVTVCRKASDPGYPSRQPAGPSIVAIQLRQAAPGASEFDETPG